MAHRRPGPLVARVADSGVRRVPRSSRFGLLESALSRVRQRFHYGELSSIPELAVAYAVAINANHPFLDGNKRVSFHCLLVFLRLHGMALEADPSDATRAMLDLAAGRLGEPALQAWTQARLKLQQH